jgi:UDP-glucose 4-epimerase
MSKILVTGGTGYIGSHTVVELITAGQEVVIVDNLSNSKRQVLDRIKKITGQKPQFIKADLRDRSAVKQIFQQHKFDSVMHFAGLKAVGESVEQPLRYYDNNINSTLVLVEAMLAHGVKKLIFSSSATVYGAAQDLPIKETSPVGIGLTNPYGWTKFMIEQILSDVVTANPDFTVTLLRYFNPIGAHPSGLIGEDPNGLPNNLLPFVSQVAIGKLDQLKVFGDDYDTADGTGVRDYIHVVDLAQGHVAALNNMQSGLTAYNLGSGQGVSVLDIIKAFEEASGKTIPYVITDRRAGDIAVCYASADKAAKKLGWQVQKSLLDACRDSWNWQSNNPAGYGD